MILRSRCMLPAALLGFALLLPARSANAFAGNDILKGEPWWHERISSVACRAAGFSAEADSSINWHADYIDSYGYSPLWWVHDFDKTGANRFRYSMAQVGELEKMHFDDLTSADDVRAMWNRYLTGCFVGLQWAADHNDVAAAHNIIGCTLHAVEDFYSHSSWLNSPDRRTPDHTWLASAPADRVGREVYTGAYEHPETAIKHHGKINLMCSILSQPELKPLAEALCTAISPMSNSSLCAQFKDCRDGTSVQYVVSDNTLPNGLMFLSPPGIALDNLLIAKIGVKQRDLLDASGKLLGARTQKPAHEELFDDAIAMATAAATEWLQALDRAMTASGRGEFWSRVKNMPQVEPDPVMWSQFEDFRNLPYMFMSAGAYPPDAAQRDEKDEVYLRLRLKTANEANAGTDGAIRLHADGRTYDLDWAPDAALPMRINDFEQGDNMSYTVGPFDRVPSEIRIENRGIDMGDLGAALQRDIENLIQKFGEFIKNTALALVSGEADRVADTNVKFDLASVRRDGSQSVSLDLNGGSEGHYALDVVAQRVAGGGPDGQHTRAWSRYRIIVNTLRCHAESKWDRGSDSDEPFVLLSLLPMPYGGYWGQRQAGIVGPYEDIDSGEAAGVGYVFGDVDLPDDVGVLALKAVQYESDDEPASDRQQLLADMTGWMRDQEQNHQPTSMDILSQGIAGDWKLEEIEVYAFSRHPHVRGGTVLNQRVDQWIPSNSTASFALSPDRVRAFDAEVAPFVTPRDAALSSGGSGGGGGGGGGGGTAAPIRDEFGQLNLAWHKPASQSETFLLGRAELAVDGNRDGHYNNGSVTWTQEAWSPWWEVDLGAVFELESVRVWNRDDAQGQRNEGFYVLVSKEPFPEGLRVLPDRMQTVESFVFGTGSHTFAGQRAATVRGKPMLGRYVRIACPALTQISLAEVEVFGHEPSAAVVEAAALGPNRAKGQPAQQSSTGYNAPAERAVDGNTDGGFSNGSVTHTNEEATAWWEVDLGQSHDVSKIRIWNRTDCCPERLDGITVIVSDDRETLDAVTKVAGLTGSNSFAAAILGTAVQGMKQTKGIYGSPGLKFNGAPSLDVTSERNRRGRYVRIVQPLTHILSLAEVEVFGQPVGP